MPSPQPLEVVELGAIRSLLASGSIVVAVGGGGIPATRRGEHLAGIDAVIDKDRASSLLARELGAERLVILTEVPAVYAGFGTDAAGGAARALRRRRRGAPPRAARPARCGRRSRRRVEFVRATGREALITSPAALGDALDGPHRHAHPRLAEPFAAAAANQARQPPGGGGIEPMHAAAPRIRKPVVVAAALALGALALTMILTRFPAPGAARASSHSEAPLISQDPRADNTDLYAFVSPDDTNTVTMIANYIPLEAPASGPNFYSFDDSVLYQIGIDQNGDGHADIGYQFRFTHADAEPGHVPLQHRADHVARRPELEPAADVHASRASG